MTLRLSDGGHLAKKADGTIVRFSARGKPLVTLRPSDPGYSYWLGLLHAARSREEPEAARPRGGD